MKLEYFPNLEYKHCIAYSMFVEDLINALHDPEIRRECKIIRIENDRFYINTGIRKIDLDILSVDTTSTPTLISSRVGNFEFYWTHCYEFNKDSKHDFMIDGDLCEKIKYSYDYTEEMFFQNSLLYKNCDLFYIILFNYLKCNLNHSFCMASAPLPEDFFKLIPNLLYIATEKGYYGDLLELMKNIHPNNNDKSSYLSGFSNL